MTICNIYPLWVFITVLSTIFLVRMLWQLKEAVQKDMKFKLTRTELIVTWVSLAYIISYLILVL